MAMQARAIEFLQLGKQATEILYMYSPVGSQRDRHLYPLFAIPIVITNALKFLTICFDLYF